MDRISHDLVDQEHAVVSDRIPPVPQLISVLLTHKGHAEIRSFAHVPLFTILDVTQVKFKMGREGWPKETDADSPSTVGPQ